MDRKMVEMTAKLYECHRAAKQLLGSHFERDMGLWAEVIRAEASAKKCSELQAAIFLSKEEIDGFRTITILAAYVEMTETSSPKKRAVASTS